MLICVHLLEFCNFVYNATFSIEHFGSQPIVYVVSTLHMNNGLASKMFNKESSIVLLETQSISRSGREDLESHM